MTGSTCLLCKHGAPPARVICDDCAEQIIEYWDAHPEHEELMQRAVEVLREVAEYLPETRGG